LGQDYRIWRIDMIYGIATRDVELNPNWINSGIPLLVNPVNPVNPPNPAILSKKISSGGGKELRERGRAFVESFAGDDALDTRDGEEGRYIFGGFDAAGRDDRNFDCGR